jgi:hypothetical protein
MTNPKNINASVIFTDGFETGDFSAWTTTVSDSGDMSVEASAALAGTSYGNRYVIDDTTTLYTMHDLSTPNTSGVMRARFYFDPNNLTIGPGETFDIAVFYNSSTQAIARIMVDKSSGFTIKSGIYNDSGGGSTTPAQSVTDGPHFVEFVINRATNDTSSDGRMQLWIDNVDKYTISGIDNYDRFVNIDTIYLCAYQLDIGTSGTFFLDQIVVNDDGNEIGEFTGDPPEIPENSLQILPIYLIIPSAFYLVTQKRKNKMHSKSKKSVPDKKSL